jgi:hypothetical protein
MKKLFILVLLFNAFLSDAQESFFKGNNNYQAPTIFTPTISTTTVVSNISRYGASSGGTITNNGGSIITASGICWSSISNTPTISDSKTTDGISSGTFTSILNGLTAGVTYNVRAYATNSVGTSYGPAQTFMTTPTAIIPAVGDSYGGGIVGYVYQNGDPGYTSSNIPILITSTAPQGFTRWHNGSNVTTGATASVLGTGFTNTNTIISVQGTVTTSYAAGLARAHNGGGFTDWYLPSQDELNKLYINKNTIGGFTGTMNYFWTSTESSASTAKMQNFLSGGAITDFAKSASGGYVRAVRTVVLSPTTIPVVTTSTPASSISTTSAIVGGNVTDEGITQVTARGIVYGTTAGSSTYTVTTGSGAGTFSTTLTGLTAGTTYFVRSFATNMQGTAYGAEINFITLSTPIISATASPTSINTNSVISGGTITGNGGSSILTSGLVWGISANPTIALSTKTTDGTTSGTFTSSITGLTAGTTYHVRAYATNSIGTSYGPDITFATLTTPPFQAPNIVQTGLILNLDAANPASYSGTGNTWTNLVTGNAVPSFSISSGAYVNSDGGVIRFPSTGGFAESNSTTGFANLTGFTVEVWVKMAGTKGDYSPVASSNYAPCLFSEKVSGGTVNMALAYNARAWSGAANNSYRYTAAMGGWSTYEPTTNYGSDLNNWVQIVATYNGSVLKLYRNGVELGSSTTNVNLRATSVGYYIAHRWDMSDGVYGDYSSVNMYSRALSLSEITTNFNAVKSRFGL